MPKARADIVIFGGGVAGLWTRFALERAGFSTVLLSTTDLGDGQTVLSQGILHSGVKYALSAQAAEASRQLLAVQGVWKAAIEGSAGPDLRRVRVLAERMYLWNTQGLLSKLTAAVGSLAMYSGTKSLSREALPPAFAGAPRGVSVWEVQERAIDATSLMTELAVSARGTLVRYAPGAVIEKSEPAVVVRGTDARGAAFEVTAGAAVFAAGVGNEDLLQSIGIDTTEVCQRRPLLMYSASGAPAELFGHCVQELSDKPRLTVTTSTGAGGERVWYLGGDIAETAAGRADSQEFAAAERHVAECVPWLKTSGMRWRSIRVDRAEGRTPDGRRPDGPVVRSFGNVIAVWPTKLALAPTAADMVRAALSLEPTGRVEGELRGLTPPAAARPPWTGGAP